MDVALRYRYGYGYNNMAIYPMSIVTEVAI